jgi:hypothetical protein
MTTASEYPFGIFKRFLRNLFSVFSIYFINKKCEIDKNVYIIIYVYFSALLSTTVGFQFFSPRQLIISGGLIGSIGLTINAFANSIFFHIFSQYFSR